MRIHLLAVGTRMPAWVQAGFDEYAGRLPPEYALVLHEIPAEKRGKNADTRRIQEREAQKLLDAVPKGARVIALDVKGRGLSTEGLSEQMQQWALDGRDVALLVGGPEDLTDACRTAADQLWSLSPLTFPHPLVRVILAEQLYRAWSILANHPYHRA